MIQCCPLPRIGSPPLYRRSSCDDWPLDFQVAVAGSFTQMLGSQTPSLSLVCPFQARLVNVCERFPEPPPPPPHASVPTYAPAVAAAAAWAAQHRIEPPTDDDRHMTSPYIPPDVVAFYESPQQPPPGDKADNAAAQVVVDNKDDRSYTFFESFYPEAPMTHSEQYPTPLQEVYSANEFAQTWSTFNEPPPPETQTLVDVVVEEPTETDVNHNKIESKQAPPLDVDVVISEADDTIETDVFCFPVPGGGDMGVISGDKADVTCGDGRETAFRSSEAPSVDGDTVSDLEWSVCSAKWRRSWPRWHKNRGSAADPSNTEPRRSTRWFLSRRWPVSSVCLFYQEEGRYVPEFASVSSPSVVAYAFPTVTHLSCGWMLLGVV